MTLRVDVASGSQTVKKDTVPIYGSQLWSPYLTKHINMIEKTQRSFTRYISGMQGLSYQERLAVLKLYSLQRRRERYIIIYVRKILECQVPNFSPPIRSRTSDRRGRTCIASHVGVGRLGTLAYNSFSFTRKPLSTMSKNDPHLEELTISIAMDNTELLITNVYIPPASSCNGRY